MSARLELPIVPGNDASTVLEGAQSDDVISFLMLNTMLALADNSDMMTFGKIGEYVQAEPFRPFRIKMTIGQAFDIRHPEMILVGRSSVRVYGSQTSDEIPPQWQDVSMMLMETIEPLVAPSTRTGN